MDYMPRPGFCCFDRIAIEIPEILTLAEKHLQKNILEEAGLMNYAAHRQKNKLRDATPLA
jgi:hypothetical protein